jgi:hypothetical protein
MTPKSLLEKFRDLRKAREGATLEGEWQTRFIYRLFDVSRKDPGTIMFGDAKQDWKDPEFIADAANFHRTKQNSHNFIAFFSRPALSLLHHFLVTQSYREG